MKIIWLKSAKDDLNSYKENSKIITDKKVEDYINSLIDYVDTLQDFHQTGKFLFNNNGFEIRQLLYHMHRIFYAISNGNIYVISIYHTSRNINNILKYLGWR